MSKNTCRKVFVTGTDTDIGKTYITGLIIKKMIDSGFDATYFKAAASGNEKDDNGDLIPGDAAVVKKISGLRDDLKDLIPYVYEVALSPHLACQIEGHPVDMDVVRRYYQALCSRHEYITMEGSGGILCPINVTSSENEIWLEDVIKEFKMSCIVIADAGLGTINHTVLTTEYMRHAGICVKGIILNHYHPVDRMEEDNIRMIERRSGIRVIAKVKDGDTDLDIDGDYLASLYD